MRAAAPTAAEILRWPVTVDVVLAGKAYGLGRGTSYELARRAAFPVKVRRIGTRLRVATADIVADLGISTEIRQPLALDMSEGAPGSAPVTTSYSDRTRDESHSMR